MGCHPSHWRSHIFQDSDCTTQKPWLFTWWLRSALAFYNILPKQYREGSHWPGCAYPVISFYIHIKHKTSLWFGTWLLWLSIYWECHHPNWRSPWFFRGVGQPPTSKMFGEKSPTPHCWFTPPVRATDKGWIRSPLAARFYYRYHSS